jgi:two-component system, sensor histidine kinase LadS
MRVSRYWSGILPAVFWAAMWALPAATALAQTTADAKLTPRTISTSDTRSGAPKLSGMPLNGSQTRMPLVPWATQWFDPQGDAGAPEALEAARQGSFQPAVEAPTMLHPDSALWYRLELQSLGRAGKWYMRIGTPSVDHMSVHWRIDDNTWRSQTAGDSLPTKDWPLSHRMPLFEVPSDALIEADGTFEVWVRLHHARVPFFSPIEVMHDAHLRWVTELGYLLFGLFYGMVVVALAICAQQVVAVRDRAFAAYAGITAAMALLQGMLTGLIGQFLLSGSPQFNNQLSFTAAEIYAISGLVFVYVTCNLERHVPRLALGLRSWISLGAVLVVAHAIWPTRMAFVVSNIYMPVSMLITASAPLIAHRRGERWAKWIFIGIFPVVIGAAVPLMRNQGWIATGFWTQYGLMMAASLELIILMVVLNRRSRELHETEVRERALSSTDALTGLCHEQLFYERLHGAIVRARRYEHQAGLLMIHLNNHVWFQKEHGNQVAERALVLMASRIRAVARDVDTVTRLHDNVFVLLLEGPVSHAGMVHAATKVLARSLQPAEALPIGTQLKAATTMALIPDRPGMRIEDETEEGLSAQHRVAWLLHKAQERLQEANAKPIQAINF